MLHKIYSRKGFREWLLDAETIAQGSVDQTLEGKHYYCSMGLHKEEFDASVHRRVEDITSDFQSINSVLLKKSKKLHRMS